MKTAFCALIMMIGILVGCSPTAPAPVSQDKPKAACKCDPCGCKDCKCDGDCKCENCKPKACKKCCEGK